MSLAACTLHPDQPSAGTCARCGRFACSGCLGPSGRCRECAARQPAAPWSLWVWLGLLFVGYRLLTGLVLTGLVATDQMDDGVISPGEKPLVLLVLLGFVGLGIRAESVASRRQRRALLWLPGAMGATVLIDVLLWQHHALVQSDPKAYLFQLCGIVAWVAYVQRPTVKAMFPFAPDGTRVD